MVNYGYLLQAAISKRFGAQTRGFDHWIWLEEYYTLFFYKNLFYKNVRLQNCSKIKNIVVNLLVVISISFARLHAKSDVLIKKIVRRSAFG